MHPDAGLNVLHALLLTTIIDAIGRKVGAVRVAQICGAVIARAAADLDINETKNWMCATVFFESVASALDGLMRTVLRVDNGAFYLGMKSTVFPILNQNWKLDAFSIETCFVSASS
jgi:hypothetical protein